MFVIINRIPHISNLMVENMDEVLAFGETLVIGNGSEEFRSVPERLRQGQVLVDLVRVSQRRSDTTAYDGICW